MSLRRPRPAKIWESTLINVDKIRDEIDKKVGERPSRTELLDWVFKSPRVQLMTLNFAKKRRGIL